MKTELLKIRSLPTPRNTALGVVSAVVLACVITLIVGPDQGSNAWHKAPDTAGKITVVIGAMVLGAWLIGLEFASNTMRLAATAQPDRVRLIFSKLAATKLLLVTYVLITLGITFAASALMANIGASRFDTSSNLRAYGGYAATAVLWGLLAFGFALLLQSYTGGVVAALVLSLGLDPALKLIPTVGDYTYGSALQSIQNLCSGDPADLQLWQAILTAAGWLLVIIGLASVRFVKRDLK